MARFRDSHHSSIRLLSGPQCLVGLRRHLTRFLDPLDLDSRATTLVLLAVEEAAANVLEHGYRLRAGRPILLEFHPLDEERFEISLADRAPRAVLPANAASLRDLAEERSERGRGLELMRAVADSVEHAPREESGNTWTLVFSAQRLDRCVEENSREAA